MTSNLPKGSGLSYYDVEDMVETIVNMKKAKYQFGGTDPEDLAQEIRLICWESLQKFDQSKVGKSVFHFVARCVDNALYNKFRGIYLDNNPPCLRCPEYIKETKQCAIQESGCTRIVQYRDRMARRRAIASPLSYNNATPESNDCPILHDNMSVGSTTGACDLDDTFRSSLDPNLVPYYDKMISGHENEVPAHFKRLVQTQVRLIMEEEGK